MTFNHAGSRKPLLHVYRLKEMKNKQQKKTGSNAALIISGVQAEASRIKDIISPEEGADGHKPRSSVIIIRPRDRRYHRQTR